MIGSNLVKRLVAAGVSVRVVDNLWRGSLEHLVGDDGQAVIDLEQDFHHLDLTVPGVLEPVLEDMELVVHLADVVAGIGYVFGNQGWLFRQNVLINSNVAASARASGIHGLIYVGTACSYPAALQTGVAAPPLREDELFPAAPESAYGWSKLMGHVEFGLLGAETDVETLVLLLHNVYGSPTDYSAERGQVIPSLIRKAIRYPDEAFVVWGSGRQGRAFVHVSDVVDAIVAAAGSGFGHGLIQVGPDVCTSIREIAETVVAISGKDIEIEYDATAPEGDLGRCADYSKARDVLGWEPRVSIADGLRDLYEWIETRILEAHTVSQRT
jgi:GDP-D-mannose 3',5'-epimerase